MRTTVTEATISGIYVDRDDPACPSRYLHVRIYETVEEMREAAARHNARRGFEEDLSGAHGLFQPRDLRENWRGNYRADTTGRFIGVMRLCADHLGGETIAHESTHAALHAWRMHQWALHGLNVVELGDCASPTEERFAYLLGGIAGEVANVVWRFQQREDTVMARE